MKYLSVCSGIEAASVAWQPLGWNPVAFAEIEKFPNAVLSHHYPTVPNWGDLTRFREWPDATIDLLVGGTPCQSFSVAGLRKGLDDPRGNLALTYLAVAARYRPRWVVWENVPGVLSIDGGRAFGAFVGGLAKLGYGFAYRVLDAQHFGVPQRRRRVFVVGCLGDWRRAAAVLFERESLSGHPAPSRETGKRIANAITERPDRGGGNSEGQRLIAPTLPSRMNGPDFDCDGGLVANAVSTKWRSAPEESRDNVVVAHALQGMTVRRLTPREWERLQGFPDDYTFIPLKKRNKKAEQDDLNRAAQASAWLTGESEWKWSADGPRYKALGNSMAVPVVRWIGERIAMMEGVASEAAA